MDRKLLVTVLMAMILSGGGGRCSNSQERTDPSSIPDI
jgi:hypothetical protein